MIDLVYCAGGNEVLMRLAYEAGLFLGVRSDRPSYGFPIQFVDINYRHPPLFADHLRVVARHRPRFAVVGDLSEHRIDEADIERAIREARILADYCEVPLVVPKLSAQLALLPGDLAIGVSLPTTHGGAQYAFWELAGRRLHLLGGNPAAQMEAYRYLSGNNRVLSTDGNMAQKVAWSAGYWEGGHWVDHPSKGLHRPNLAHTCFELSCCNIVQEWQQFFARDIPGEARPGSSGAERPVLAACETTSGKEATHAHR